jgi:type I restriction enzyme M protein
MALKKSELYSSLWQSCDELRGGMDASQYKDYVLVLLFVKYISDKYAGQPYAPITIPPGASFRDMVALKGKTDIGDQINKRILGPLAQANPQLSQSDFADFNDPNKLGSGKEMVDRLGNLIAIFENPALDFSKNRADGDDLLGDAYEYLMRHFATESGKSKGQFLTPAEVSLVLALILGVQKAAIKADTTAYDPTCGSASLLLKIGAIASQGKDVRITLYGQEKDSSTAGLARMNMILHDYATAEIKQGNTLSNPLFFDGDALKTFDYAAANPPFSDKRWSTGLDPEHDPFQRFQAYGIPPAKQGDYAYLLHIIRSLKSTGKGACILPHGVLFRGNAEAVIRRNLVQRGIIKGIIGLPANLFYGTGIPACIIVIDKEHAQARKGIFMIDASKGFRKDGPKNRLREQDIHRIVDTFNRQAEIPGYARMVPVSEISDAKNDYNLNLPRYIDSTEAEDIQDISAHLRGGIPNRDLDGLARYWQVIPGVRAALFKKADRPGYSQLRIPAAEIKTAIFAHPEFTAFNESATKLFAKWAGNAKPRLGALTIDAHPKALIATISEDLLTTFEKAPLLDAYDVYQHLMDYWSGTMQDDCYLIAGDGWKKAAQPQLIIEEKGSKTKTKPDFNLGKKKYAAELIPPALVIARYYAKEQAKIDTLEAEIAAITQQIEEMAEEHGGEDGLLADAKNDKDKLTKASVAARLKELTANARPGNARPGNAKPQLGVKKKKAAELGLGAPGEDAEEIAALQAYLTLSEQEAATSSKLKAAQDALIAKVAAKYGQLTEDEIKTLVVDDKWLATLAAAVQGELDRVSQTLTGRIRQLAARYATPLPQLTGEVEQLAAKVTKHLKKMGVEA